MARISGLSSVNVPSVPVRAPSTFVPSPQQADVFAFVEDKTRRNAVVEAVAGAGKTTTLVEVCKRVKGTIAFLAFNKKIAEEIGHKLEKAGIPDVKATTFHAAGFAAWRKVHPRVRVNERKLDDVMDFLGVPKNFRAFVAKAASLGKQGLFGVAVGLQDMLAWATLVDHFDLEELLQGKDDLQGGASRLDLALDWTIRVIEESNRIGDQTIDFNDMLYLPLWGNCSFQQYNWILVDEAQDTNMARRMMVERMCGSASRVIAVGDRHQAIYGFTGADNDSLDRIASTFDCEYLPLTVTYRCPKTVVDHAQRWVQHIQAHESAPEGELLNISDAAFKKGLESLKPTDAILCRNTRPLVQIAFELLRRKKGCFVEGRDIGKGLLELARRWKGPRNCGEMLEVLEDYYEKEITKYMQQKKEHKIEQLKDKVETLKVMVEFVGLDSPLYVLEQEINSLFRDSSGEARQLITLSTVHKSKGREWDRVFLYGRDQLMPSRYAKQEWELEQEKNLIYVAVTRAKRFLVEVFLTPGLEDEEDDATFLGGPLVPEATAPVPAPKVSDTTEADQTIGKLFDRVEILRLRQLVKDAWLEGVAFGKMYELLDRPNTDEVWEKSATRAKLFKEGGL